MQKLMFTLGIALFTFFQAQSQTKASAIVFTENGEKFIAYLNGQKMNETPESRVRMPELDAEFYKLKLDFEDPTFTDFSGNMMVEMGKELTYMAKINKKGNFVIRPVSEATYAADKPAIASEPLPPSKPATPSRPSPAEKPAQTETTTTTTTVTTGNPEGMKMDVEVNGSRMTMDVKVPGMEMEETTTVTTTTSTTSSTTHISEEEVMKEEEIVEETGGCGFPMPSGDFATARESIESKSFEDSQLTLAKQITRSNCLKAEQVKSIIEIFDFEDTKLEFAKFAFDYTVDQNNYYIVNDAFGFESSIEELNEYLESK